MTRHAPHYLRPSGQSVQRPSYPGARGPREVTSNLASKLVVQRETTPKVIEEKRFGSPLNRNACTGNNPPKYPTTIFDNPSTCCFFLRISSPFFWGGPLCFPSNQAKVCCWSAGGIARKWRAAAAARHLWPSKFLRQYFADVRMLARSAFVTAQWAASICFHFFYFPLLVFKRNRFHCHKHVIFPGVFMKLKAASHCFTGHRECERKGSRLPMFVRAAAQESLASKPTGKSRRVSGLDDG